MIEVFFVTWHGTSKFSFAAWTLPYELYSSFYAFGLAVVVGSIRQKWVVYLCVFSFLYLPLEKNKEKFDFSFFSLRQKKAFLLFTYGVLLADLESSGFFKMIKGL